MLDLKIIKENPEKIKEIVVKRGMNPQVADVDALLATDDEHRALLAKVEAMRSERNTLSASIPKLPAAEKGAAVAKVKALKEELTAKEGELTALADKRNELWRAIPNLLAADVPDGGEDDAIEIKKWGELPKLENPRDHVVLGQMTDTIDFERAAKVTGAGFYYLKREAALLEQALISFAMGKAIKAGFCPMSTPDLARDTILSGIGFNPRGPETQVYSIQDMDISLVGTAEITLGGYRSDEVLKSSELPLQFVGLSHCFRTEAGAYGRTSRGLYRVHQFSKVELFVICPPEESVSWHEKILALEESILQKLKIPYRVINIAAGDLGAPALKKYDIEAWMPGRNAYGEVTSCSNCTDYQTRRLGVRFKNEQGKVNFCHMLNGTATAVSRMLIAVMENYQNSDGTINIPEALLPYMHGITTIPLRS